MEGMLNYFVPEDGDSSDHLNVVPLPRVDQLRLQHVKKAFPLPGEFHFRFKTAFEGTYVWLDVVDDAEVVPDFNGLVISKISRVQRASAADGATATVAATEASRAPAPVKAPAAPTPDLIETSLPSTPHGKREEPAAPAKAFNDDLVGLLSDPVPLKSPATSAPPTPTPAHQSTPGAPPDPFNLFMGGGGAANNTATSMRPQSSPMNPPPRGPVQGAPGSYGGPQPGNQGFNPMGSGGPGSMGPRPVGSMNISQMHMGMPQGHQQQQQQHQQQQQQHSFQGLQWQGMGGQQQQQQQQQARGNPMQPNQRQW